MFKLFPETFLIQFYLAHTGEAKTNCGQPSGQSTSDW